MACFKLIYYQPHRAQIDNAEVLWSPESSNYCIKDLPQIFWRDGHPWNEVNLWALEMLRSREVKLKTVKSLMEHLHKYANWLEESICDWRHFPITKSERVLVRYRGSLIDSRDHGELSPSTTSARMRAVIRFYRYCTSHNFISHAAPKWQNKTAIIKYFDPVGFERTMTRITTSISIPNRQRSGLRLEDGLLPLSSQHMLDLLSFTEESVSPELHLMLLIGFFTGARLGTITTLRINSINQSIQDPMAPGMWVIRGTPNDEISTGSTMTDDELINEMTLCKAMAIHFSHHAEMRPGVYFPEDLIGAIQNRNIWPLSCSVIWLGHTMAPVGDVGVIFNPKTANIVSVSDMDSGSSNYNGEENSAGEPLTWHTFKKSLEVKEHYNEWRVIDAEVTGIFVTNPKMIIVKKLFKHDFLGEVMGHIQVSLDEIRATFPQWSLYTMSDKDIIKL